MKTIRVRVIVWAMALAGLALTECAAVSEGQTSPPRKAITIAAGGVSEYVIVIPDEEKYPPDVKPKDLSDLLKVGPFGGQEGRVRRAADLLQALLAEATGAKLPIVKEAEAPVGKPRILLGKTKAAIAAGIPVESLKPCVFLKRVVGRDLFLAGFDAKACSWEEYWGTLKAVTSFLEDEAGVRFLLPGPNGIHVPKLDALKVDSSLNVTAAAKIPYCDFWYGKPWQVQNIALNFQHPGSFFASGHSYHKAVPLEKYGKTHSEYFALIDGQRVASDAVPEWKRHYLCISNPEVQELMLKEMEKEIDAGYEWVSLLQSDGYIACQCENCKAIAGEYKQVGRLGYLPQYGNPEALWIVHRKLAEEMRKRRPGKKVVIYSYGPTIEPPTSFDSFPDNVAITMCSYSPEDFEKWRRFPCEKAVYNYNWGAYQPLGFLPKRTPLFVESQIRLFAANNVKVIEPDGGSGANFGLEGPTYYVYGKLLFNPDANALLLADEFYRAAYGKASASMKAFFDALYKRLELYSNLPTLPPGYDKKKHPRSQEPIIPRRPEDMLCAIFPPDLVLILEDNLNRAFAADDDPHVQARLRLVRREFEYLKNIASIFVYYRAYRMSNSWAAFDLLEAELKRRDALIDSWYVENPAAKTNPKAPKFVMKVEDGWHYFFGYYGGSPGKDELRQGGVWMGELSASAPFNWDMKQLRENKMRTAAGASKPKMLKIARLDKSITIDGVPEKEAWNKASVEELGEACMGTLKDRMTFQAAYDDTALYFAFTCQYAAIGQAKFAPLGRDGDCWSDECLEILLDPFGMREKYYHFIFNPVPGSFYDARKGFTEDPLDPQFGKEDVSWNGAWEYAAKVDAAGKRWTAEARIPFASLGVPPPKPGEKWTMNIGREHPTGGGPEKKEVEFSLWSPNLEKDFCSPAAFGTLIFE